MALTSEEQIRKLEEMLARMESRRQESPAAKAEETDELSDDEVLVLTENEEIPSEAPSEEEIPEIPEEFEERAPAIEMAASPAAPLEIEPVAPVEPGPVAPEFLARAAVTPIEVRVSPVAENLETTLDLYPAAKAKESPKPTRALPLVPEPRTPERPSAMAEPPVTLPQPVVPEPLPRAAFEAAAPIAHARPAAFEGEIRPRKPRTIGDILRSASRIGKK